MLRAGALTAGCAACAVGPAPPPADGSPPAARSAEEAPLHEFIARAAPGDHAELAAAGEGAALQVTLEQEYHAASGRLCRQLRLGADGAEPELRHACRDDQGEWRLLPPLLNRGRDVRQAL